MSTTPRVFHIRAWQVPLLLIGGMAGWLICLRVAQAIFETTILFLWGRPGDAAPILGFIFGLAAMAVLTALAIDAVLTMGAQGRIKVTFWKGWK